MQPPLKLEKSETLFAEALDLVPGGVLGIRRPYNFVPGEYPVFFSDASGGRVRDVDGNEYVDMLCAYGPIIVGHREGAIDDAVVDQIRGRGFCMSLVQPVQNELARRLREVIPCAEMTLLVKTGSDATTLAIRLARGRTGRTRILRCGYHGWHDWCVEVKGGVPAKLYEDVDEFPYGDLDVLEEKMKAGGDEVAAIIMTPIGHALAHNLQPPPPGFLEGVRSLADRYGAVLIFDEIRTGFRLDLGGAMRLYGVTPDLATVGKAMANGYPIAAVVGRRDVMNVARKDVFVSSTYFPNSLEMVAALATIDFLERESVLDAVRSKGEWLRERVRELVARSGVPAEISEVPQMPFVVFPPEPNDSRKIYRERRTVFYTEVIRHGVFLQPYHHGYVMYRHTEEDLNRAALAIEAGLEAVRHEVG